MSSLSLVSLSLVRRHPPHRHPAAFVTVNPLLLIRLYATTCALSCSLSLSSPPHVLATIAALQISGLLAVTNDADGRRLARPPSCYRRIADVTDLIDPPLSRLSSSDVRRSAATACHHLCFANSSARTASFPPSLVLAVCNPVTAASPHLPSRLAVAVPLKQQQRRPPSSPFSPLISAVDTTGATSSSRPHLCLSLSLRFYTPATTADHRDGREGGG